MYTYVFTYTYLYVYMYVGLCVNKHILINICMYVCTFAQKVDASEVLTLYESLSLYTHTHMLIDTYISTCYVQEVGPSEMSTVN